MRRRTISGRAPAHGRSQGLALAVGLAVSLGAALGPATATAQEPHRQMLGDKLRAELEAVASDFAGVAGIQVVDLTSGERFGVNEALVFPQGSAIKIPILLELVRRGEAEPGLLARRVEVGAEVQAGGSGVLEHFGDGTSALSLEDLAVLMIVLSDNTATNVLIDAVGMDAVNRLMDDLGAPRTRLQRKMIRPEASARGDENLSTPAEAAGLMARIHSCDLPLSEAGCRRVRQILEIPKGGPLPAPIPGDVPVAFKPGGIEGVTTAWGLVGLSDRPYAIAVMTNYGGPGGEAVQAASRAAWEYFRRLSRATGHGARVPLDVIRHHRPPPP